MLNLDRMLNIASGYLAGLSVGVYCLGLCLPVFLPVLLSQKRNLKKSFRILLEFSLGRLCGYLLFGLIVGYLGQTVQNKWIHTIVSLINLWTGIMLIVYSLGQIDKKLCALIPFKKIKWPFLIGFLTGVNVCPPMVASLTHVFNLKSAINSLLYFLLFFFGTSTYIIPAAFLGIFTKSNLIQKIARLGGVLAGLYFIIRNVILLF